MAVIDPFRDVAHCRRAPARLLAAALDLVLPQECLGCGRSGVPLCASCATPLLVQPRPAVPTPAPAGFPPTWAVAPYDAVVRSAVVAHKEEGRRDLAPALSFALAASLQAALHEVAATVSPVLVVPVPSRRASRRARGDDPTGRLARLAVARLDALTGRPGSPQRSKAPAPRLVRLLNHARGVADQAGLDAAARRANLAGALVAGRLPGWAGPGTAVVVVDDVLTTGATLAEAARALRVAGAGAVVGAVVAATIRRHPSRPLKAGRLVPATPDD